MIESLRRFFSEDGFMPHGHCYLWQPGVLWLHIVSDALIVLAYFSIPFTLIYFVRKRGDLEFNWMFVCFAVFIVACGATHLMEIWNVWHPAYWLAGGLKALTALASVPTSILLAKLVPTALQLPSPSTLQRANEQLQREVAERTSAEDHVRRLNQELESRVAQRTRELEAINCDLVDEIQVRRQAQDRQQLAEDRLQQAYEDLRQTQKSILQQERLQALGQIASGVAHDINNAISPIVLYTESLLRREPNLSDQAREQIGTIQGAIENVARTVARMREFYRQREPERVPAHVDLNRIVREAIDLTQARWSDVAQQKGGAIVLRTDLSASLPDTIGAENEIRDALANLIFNAANAMPQGGALTLRTRSTQRGDAAVRYACVEVCDTGIGMDEETRRRCLEPFFTTKGERGTGLGLAMVYGMVKRHGAELEIDSAPGKGTTMRLLFPAAEPILMAVVHPA